MTMKIMDTEFEFDIFDIDQSEAYEKAIENLSLEETAITAAKASKKMSEMNRAMINMFRTFFKTATGIDVLATCKNSNAASEAYYDFITAVGKQKAYVVEKYDTKRVR